jgi:hypothetical protein
MHAGDKTTATYPCNLPEGPNDCGTSTFTDQTSDASPLVSDCQQIIANIIGTDGEWSPENVDTKVHTIASYGSCHFDVQSNQASNGNVDYSVGASDIVDLINSSVQMFASNGKVGSKGVMSCSGDVSSVQVTWGLY